MATKRLSYPYKQHSPTWTHTSYDVQMDDSERTQTGTTAGNDVDETTATPASSIPSKCSRHVTVTVNHVTVMADQVTSIRNHVTATVDHVTVTGYRVTVDVHHVTGAGHVITSDHRGTVAIDNVTVVEE